MLAMALGCCAVEQLSPAWQVEVALETPDKLGGCAAGDLLPEVPGDELAVVSNTGAIRIVWHDGEAWRSEVAFQAPGEMIQCAVGDVDPDRPGDEIVAVGMASGGEDSGGPGAAWYCHRNGVDGTGTGWSAERIFEDSALCHGVSIGPHGVFAFGFTNRVFQLERGQDGWRATPVASLPGAGKNGVDMAGGVAIACNDGSLVLLAGGPAGWRAEVIDRRAAGRARVGTGGERLIVADDDGMLSIVTPGAAGREVVHQDTDKLRGAVLADLDPSSHGLEAATAGYGRTITVLAHGGGVWQPVFVHDGKDRFHHLIAAELDGQPGLELAACGYAGELLIVRPARAADR